MIVGLNFMLIKILCFQIDEELYNYFNIKVSEIRDLKEKKILEHLEKKEKYVPEDDLFLKSKKWALMQNLTEKIQKYTKANPNKFIFDFITMDIKNKENLDMVEYQHVIRNTIVYNRQLKELQKTCNIDTTLRSHLSRHSYASLMLNLLKSDIYLISQSLGHSDTSITEKYLSGFNVQETSKENNKISNAFMDMFF